MATQPELARSALENRMTRCNGKSGVTTFGFGRQPAQAHVNIVVSRRKKVPCTARKEHQ
jgi:hypothetical protein